MSRPRIPSFMRLKGAARRPPAIDTTPVENNGYGGNVAPEPRTPTKQAMPRKGSFSAPNAVSHHQATLTVQEEDGDDKITPRAYTSHVPPGSRIHSETEPPVALLTSRPIPMIGKEKTSQPPVAANAEQVAFPRAKENRKAEGRAERRSGEGVFETLGDIYPTLPKSSSSAVSLGPSARVSISSSRTGSMVRTQSPNGGFHSMAFPPTELTDLAIIPKGRNIEFHVESFILFEASPVIADLICPFPEGDGDASLSSTFYVLDEKYEVVDAILRFAHPKVIKPAVRSITHLQRLLEACKKYEIAAGLHTLSILLIEFGTLGASPTNTNPLVGSPYQCYGLACRYGFPNVAKILSSFCLTMDPLKTDLSTMVGVAATDMRRLFACHHGRGLAAIQLINSAVDAQELWCPGCAGLAAWYDCWRETAEHELKSRPVSRTIFSPSFIAGCLNQALKTCPHHCMEHYLAPKTQFRFGVLQRDIDALKDRI